MTIKLGSHTVQGNCANSYSLPSNSFPCFFLLVLLSLYHQDLHWIVLFSELIHNCALNGWCPFLASIDDGLPEEKIEPSHALFQTATIFPVGPTAHVFSSVMMGLILDGCCPFLFQLVLFGTLCSLSASVASKQECVQIYLC